MRPMLRRMPVPAQARGKSRTRSIPAPTRGWVVNENIAASKRGGALVLDNWFPTTRGIRVRGGAELAATLNDGSDPIESMWTYEVAGTEKFFGADETKVYEISGVADSTTVPDPDWSGQTAGYYSTVQIGTSGGDYLYAVNGADPALLYDGTALYEITDEETYGLAYDALSADFAEGETVTGGTSGASAEIVHIEVLTATTGILHVKNIASGPFQNDETITDGATGSATSNIPSGVSTINNIVVTGSGVDTSVWSAVWVHANRLFAVRKNTMVADYLGVDSVGGAASQVSLAGVFQNGGALLFGATWSLDSGSGLDDKCVFVSTTGEVAIYEGTNPGDSAAWSKVGVYQIGRPLGVRGWEKAGGDLLIATEDGIVPISEAIRKDIAALNLAAITRAIEPEWDTEVADRSSLPWEIKKWVSNNMLVASLPVTADDVPARCFVANLETGAWCRFTGWDTRCLGVYNRNGYFGTSDGKVYQMESGGQDGENPFTAIYVGVFDDLGAPGALKALHQARPTFRSTGDVSPQVSASVNYTTSLPQAPAASIPGGDVLWDSAVWDEDVWSAGLTLETRTSWASIGKSGFAVAPQLQVTSGSGVMLNIELASFDLIYEVGGVMV